MKLNCKENDLAIIVRTNGDPICTPHIGKILKLVGPPVRSRNDTCWVWAYEGPYLRTRHLTELLPV